MNCQLLESLAALYLKMNQQDKARAVWVTAFEKSPQNAEVFYHTCKFFILQVKKKEKILHINGSTQLNYMLFKGQLCCFYLSAFSKVVQFREKAQT